MVLNARIIAVGLSTLVLFTGRARAQCAGQITLDLGFSFIASANGFARFMDGPRTYTRFESNPVIHGASAVAGGFRDKDTIIAINGAAATTREAAIAWTKAADVKQSTGEALEVTVLRNGVPTELHIVPIHRCNPPPEPPRLAWLGIGLKCDDCQSIMTIDGTRGWRFTKEPVVARVDNGGNAWRAGARAGDIIVSVNGFPSTTAQAITALNSVHAGQHVVFQVRRGSVLVRLDVLAESLLLNNSH